MSTLGDSPSRNDRRARRAASVRYDDGAPVQVFDLFAYNDVNVDALTETYGLAFYLQYSNLARIFQRRDDGGRSNHGIRHG